MSRLNWRSRSVLAAGAAAVLVGTGVAALASTGGSGGGEAAPATTSPADPRLAADDRSAELRSSVDDLLSQVDALEAALAAPTPSPTPAGGGDGGGVLAAGSTGGAPAAPATYDDHGDDDAYEDDDHGDDDDGYDDDHGSDDHGDDHGEVEGDDD